MASASARLSVGRNVVYGAVVFTCLIAVLMAGCAVDGGTLPSETNEAPSVPTVAISPPTPVTTDALTASLLVESIDPEGLEVLYGLDWFADNAPRADLEDVWTVPATETAKGQLWLVHITAGDPDGALGPMASASVIVSNSTPTATVALTPTTPGTADDLAVTILLDDVDGDVVAGTPTWTVGGNPAPQFDDYQTIAAQETERGEKWTVTVIPFDGEEDGPPATASVSIVNAPPVFGNVVLSPAEVFEGDILTVSYDLPTDADDDPLDVGQAWFVDGVEVTGETTTSLTSHWFDKTDTVVCSVSVSDGIDSLVIDSNEVVVQNSPPTEPVVSISPAEPLPEDDLLCSIDQASEDADGDPITEPMAWLLNGGATVFTWVSVPSSATADGDTWTCAVTPNDGTDDGPTGSVSVLVSDCPVWYSDLDGDGYGDPATAQATCVQPLGTVSNNTDCDDQNGDAFPGAAELCGGIDLDCDGVPGPVCTASCLDLLNNGTSTSDGVYAIDVDGSGLELPQDVYCDMTTDAGGWTLILAYAHVGGTSPARVRGTTPLDPNAGFSHVYLDDIAWPSAEISEVRFYCETSAHPRLIHFKTSKAHVLDAAQTGGQPGWGASTWSTGFTSLPGHTGNLPAATTMAKTTMEGLTDQPFYQPGYYHWAVGNYGTRWECDDYPNNSSQTTLHQVWVR